MTAWFGISLLLSIPVGILLAIPYLVWIVCYVIQRDWRAALTLVACPIVIYSGLFAAAALLNYLDRADYYAKVFGQRVPIWRPEYTFDDGTWLLPAAYSIEVHPLPETLRERFLNEDVSLSAAFRDQFLRDDYCRTWSSTPVDPHEPVLREACRGSVYDENRELVSRIDDLRDVLRAPGSFYAFPATALNATGGSRCMWSIPTPTGSISSTRSGSHRPAAGARTLPVDLNTPHHRLA